jgi:hypothetical protein
VRVNAVVHGKCNRCHKFVKSLKMADLVPKCARKRLLSPYYTICFCIKQNNFHFLIYSQTPVVRHFTNWWHLSRFPWTTAFTRTFAVSILWCYNFNGMIKWYDILCALSQNMHVLIWTNLKLQHISTICSPFQSLHVSNFYWLSVADFSLAMY